uniref:Uncharacterized protein n=1 Tax=candidate division WOR-3 bacterium TaxID=2052148 RepID=A0A7C2K4Q0_UNCW3
MKYELGKRVKIIDREDWPIPYRFAEAEGVIVRWVKFEEVMRDFDEFVCVKIEKTKPEANEYIGRKLVFRKQNLVLLE